MPLGDLKSLASWLKSRENAPWLWIEIPASVLNCPGSDSLKCLLTELERRRAREVCGILMRLHWSEEGETQRFIPECLVLRQKEHVGSLPGGPDRRSPAPWGTTGAGSFPVSWWGWDSWEVTRTVLTASLADGSVCSPLPRLPVSLLLLFHDTRPLHHTNAGPSLCQEKLCINNYPIFPEPFKFQHFLKVFFSLPSPASSSPLCCSSSLSRSHNAQPWPPSTQFGHFISCFRWLIPGVWDCILCFWYSPQFLKLMRSLINIVWLDTLPSWA